MTLGDLAAALGSTPRAAKATKHPVSDVPDPEPKRYCAAFLTDQWEWEAPFSADTAEQAMAAARQALEDLVRDERPSLACVTLLEDGRKIGVWDWVGTKPHWTPL
jgi:hypothetical protein